ncbi:MAG: PQQ-binding-like beta-propeller repeat protein [Candidatus Nealsonbacteria bacterium]|nr:PQQ-binding-like beta-propeller repeat protein [Candidatus Nealsonbacteria bacterium]
MKRSMIGLAIILSMAAPALADVAELVESSGVKGGLIVHLGCGDGRDTARLRINDRYLVQGLEVDDAKVREARKHLLATKVYGKVSAYRFDGKHLPYVDNLVNLIVSERPTDVSEQEIIRVLSPLGVALIDGRKIVKPWPNGIDEWNHFLHGPDNNAVAKDRVAGSPRSLQWVSGPRWGRSHEEMASMSASVSAKGRVFFIVDEAPLASIRYMGDWKLVARDAFNGTLLWKRDIPKWNDHLRHFRSGPVHLPRRLVAVSERVYATLGLDAPVTAMDAATGETLHVYKGTERAEEILVDGGVLYVVVGTSEVNRRGGGLHRRGEPEPTDFRYITAIDIATGKPLWKNAQADGEFLLPLTLTVRQQSVFYQSTFGLVRLDARSGKVLWKTRRPTPSMRMAFSAPTVVAADGVLLASDRVAAEDAAADDTVEWGVHGWNEPGFARGGKAMLRAYSVETGEELWATASSEGYNSPVDVFVVDDTVWVGANFKGYDLKTGELKKELTWKGNRVGMPHHRCYRNKATEDFIFTGRSGIEVVSLEDGWQGNNSWIRGTCQYGIMPGNGLLYAPPDACACYLKVKVPGFFAAAPRRAAPTEAERQSPRLEKGPAYGETEQYYALSASSGWPMYRCDVTRSGSVSTRVPKALKKNWSVGIGGRLTQPVVAGGLMIVASTDAHTVYALDAAGGKSLWTYTAGGRIDSSPTLYEGTVLFGAADGWVYCLRARDGSLAWRFRAAPQERQAGVFEQLESVWPVHGAVLVQNDTLYVTAGRTSYLDGGIVLYRIDPASGKELSRTPVYHLDAETGRQTGVEPTQGFDMEGTGSDILVGDGESVFLRHFTFDRNGREIEEKKPHLFSITGLALEEWFVRSYWILGTQTGAGWGAWARTVGPVPTGRILAFDVNHVYGYGRQTIASAATGHRADAYHLFSKNRLVAPPKPAAGDAKNQRRGNKAKTSAPAPVWSDARSLIVRAMVLADDHLVVAGPPDLTEKHPSILAYQNEEEALAGFRGKRGVLLRVVSASDGETLSEHKLQAMPTFDGMSAADGRLFISLKDGTVQCWGE